MSYSFNLYSFNLVPFILLLEPFFKVDCQYNGMQNYPAAGQVANDFQNGKFDDAMDEIAGRKKPQNSNSGPAQGSRPWQDVLKDMMSPRTRENNPHMRDGSKAEPVSPNASPEAEEPVGKGKGKADPVSPNASPEDNDPMKENDYPYQGNPRPRKGGAGDAGDDDDDDENVDRGQNLRGRDNEDDDPEDEDPRRPKRKEGDEEKEEEGEGEDDADDRRKDRDDDEETEPEKEEDDDGKEPKVPYVVPPKMPKRKPKMIYVPLRVYLKNARKYGPKAAKYPYKSKWPYMYGRYSGRNAGRRRASARRRGRGRARPRSSRG